MPCILLVPANKLHCIYLNMRLVPACIRYINHNPLASGGRDTSVTSDNTSQVSLLFFFTQDKLKLFTFIARVEFPLNSSLIRSSSLAAQPDFTESKKFNDILQCTLHVHAPNYTQKGSYPHD